MSRCKAISKRTGQPCGAKAMRGKDVCYHHGGASRSGTASGTFRTGRHSKDLPTRLAARYEASLADEKLLELRDEIAVIDARLSELLQKIDTGEAGALWTRLREHRAELLEARRDGDNARQAAALSRLLAAVERGAQEWQTWQEIRQTIRDRKGLTESERGRLKEMQQNITVGQLALTLGLIEQILRKYVPDPDTLAAVARDLRPIVVGGVRGQA